MSENLIRAFFWIGEVAARVIIWLLALLLFAIFFSHPAHSQLRGPVRNLTADTTPASGDMLLVDKATPLVSRKLTLGTLATFIASLSGSVPSTRIINCTPPLLCAGTTSMDLSADRTLSIAPFYIPLVGTGYTPVSGASAPVRELTTGSTVTSALASGLRTATFRLFDTNTSDVDNALFAIDVIQSSNPGAATIKKTGLAISIYSMPDNGGDSSGLLIAQGGGGNGASIFKAHELRPFGFTDYGSAIDGALEVGTSDQSFAINAEAGLQSWCSYPGNSCPNTNIATAVWARIFNAGSSAIVAEPADGVFDTRTALAVGTHQVNSAPTNQTFHILMNGDFGSASGSNIWGVTGASQKLTNNTNDASAPYIAFSKSRALGSVNTNEDTGEMQWNFVNSSSVEKQAITIKTLAANKTSGAETADLVFSLISAGSLGERFRFTGAGRLGIGSSAPDSLLHITANTAALVAPTLSGTIAHLGNADAANTRVLIDTYGAANGAVDFRQSSGTAASPTASGSGANGGQVTWSWRGATGYNSTPNAVIQGVTEEAQTDSAHGTAILFKTTPLGSTTNREVFRIDAAGHLLSSGTAPTVACTGTGTSPSAPTIDAGGTDHKFTVTISTGTGSPGSTGTCTVTFATAFLAARPVVCMLVKGATAWGNGSTIMETTESASAPVFTWTNIVSGTPTALTVSTSYKFSCVGGF